MDTKDIVWPDKETVRDMAKGIFMLLVVNPDNDWVDGTMYADAFQDGFEVAMEWVKTLTREMNAGKPAAKKTRGKTAAK